jgi:hypothetical protein
VLVGAALVGDGDEVRALRILILVGVAPGRRRIFDDVLMEERSANELGNDGFAIRRLEAAWVLWLPDTLPGTIPDVDFGTLRPTLFGARELSCFRSSSSCLV